MNNFNTTNNNTPQIDSKNLSILEDQLNYEALATKKYQQASQMCTTQELKSVCDQAAQKHRQHYTDLLNYLNSHQ